MSKKRGSEVEPGDIITIGGAHRVKSIEPYVHPTLGEVFVGIARCEDGWSITLDDGVSIPVA